MYTLASFLQEIASPNEWRRPQRAASASPAGPSVAPERGVPTRLDKGKPQLSGGVCAYILVVFGDHTMKGLSAWIVKGINLGTTATPRSRTHLDLSISSCLPHSRFLLEFA